MAFISTLVNLLGLASSLWLGLYVLTRSPHSRISWLTALTLWSLTCFYFANALAINLLETGLMLSFRYLVLFALPSWLDLTLELIRSGEKATGRSETNLFVRAGVIFSYLFALFLVLLGLFLPSLIQQAPNSPRFYTTDPGVGPLYGLIVVFFLINASLALYILLRGRSAAFSPTIRRQFTIFLFATGVTAFGGGYVILGTLFQLNLPAFIGDSITAVGVSILGYAIAKYNALIEGHRVERDFIYSLLAVGSLTLFYVAITLFFYLARQISFFTLILTLIGSLSFNSLYDGIRVGLDRVFYRGQFEQLRANLRAFAREAGSGKRLNDQLQATLGSLCRALRIKKGFVALKQNDGFAVVATLDANPTGTVFPLSALSASEIVGVVRPSRKGLEGMALLVPLFGGGSQIGAIALSEKGTSEPYTENEMSLLDDFMEQADVIYSMRKQEENIQTISSMISDYRERERELHLLLEQLSTARITLPPAPTMTEDEMEEQVEDGFRHLHDFAYLGDCKLSTLRLVQGAMKQNGSMMSIERGKVVGDALEKALEKIRPNGAEPKSQEIPSRDWHPYLILRDSYVKDMPNREILARLYIGEGTFNRTRRRALQNVATVLIEMEQKASING